MKKRVRLTKNAMFVVCLVALIVVIALVMKFATGSDDSSNNNVTNDLSLKSVVVENAVLKVSLQDFVSDKDYQDKYQEVALTIDAKEEIQGYKMTNKQNFNKIMKLLPPDDSSPLLNNNSEKPSHEAYVLVLTGDIAKYKDNDNKTVYRVVNARVDYYKQSLLLESAYNSVYIASIDGTKEKLVKLDDYKALLNDPNNYMSMLQW